MITVSLFVIETWVLGGDIEFVVLIVKFSKSSIQGLQFGVFALLGVYKLVKFMVYVSGGGRRNSD